MENIRKFSLVVVNDFDQEIDRFNFDYADTPKNLGFEIEFTTLESRLTTYFTSAREKKLATTLNINFVPPNAYAKANGFKRFVQKYMNQRMVFEYDDTTEVKNWEGKIQKLGQEELLDWGGLVCPVSFLPGTPKYIKKDNSITVQHSAVGKSYPFKYPYTYGANRVENTSIQNSYFDDIPLRVTLYGAMSNPQVSLKDSSGIVYSTVRLEGLYITEDEHVVIDAISSKIWLYRNGTYLSAYDYVDKGSGLDSFLFAKANDTSEIVVSLSLSETGYLKASYRQYTL